MAQVVRVLPRRVAVERDVQHVAAPPEDLLAAVAVVVVDVEDGDPLAGPGGDRLGRAEETGEGPGEGENLNLPLPPGTGNDAYLAAVDRALEAIDATSGTVVVVSLGFDTYGLDPIGTFALTTDAYHEIGRRTAALGRRLVILQEGGYHRPTLGENARAWMRGAEERPFDPLPAGGFGARGAVAG